MKASWDRFELTGAVEDYLKYRQQERLAGKPEAGYSGIDRKTKEDTEKRKSTWDRPWS